VGNLSHILQEPLHGVAIVDQAKLSQGILQIPRRWRVLIHSSDKEGAKLVKGARTLNAQPITYCILLDIFEFGGHGMTCNDLRLGSRKAQVSAPQDAIYVDKCLTQGEPVFSEYINVVGVSKVPKSFTPQFVIEW
jgi:hypothetical protein